MKATAASCIALLAAIAIDASAVETIVADTSVDAFARPMQGLLPSERERFFNGRSLIHQSWVVAPSKDASVSGLGPLYNSLACISCHPRNGRGRPPDGPDERMQSTLVRLSVAGQDAHGGPRPHPVYGGQLNEEGIPGVPGEGRAAIHWEDAESVTLAGGETVSLRRPRLEFQDLAYGPLEPVMTSLRVGQQLVGLGLLDAVPAATLRRLAAQPKAGWRRRSRQSSLESGNRAGGIGTLRLQGQHADLARASGRSLSRRHRHHLGIVPGGKLYAGADRVPARAFRRPPGTVAPPA